MADRKAISWKTKYAAALLKLGDVEYPHAKQMHEDQIISLYHVHHNIHHADGGADEYWNIEPMLIAPHKERTAKIDVPTIAKNKRIRRKAAAHQEILTTRVKPKSRWLSRPLRWRKPNAKRNDARSRKV